MFVAEKVLLLLVISLTVQLHAMAKIFFYQMFLRLGLFLLQNYAHVHQSIRLESVQGLLIT